MLDFSATRVLRQGGLFSHPHKSQSTTDEANWSDLENAMPTSLLTSRVIQLLLNDLRTPALKSRDTS